MTLINGVWYDNELNYKYGDHKFALLPNSDGMSIVVLNMPRVKNVPVFDEYGWMQGDKIALTESISMGLAENNMQDKKPKERNVLS